MPVKQGADNSGSTVLHRVNWVNLGLVNIKAVAILPLTAICPQRLFCHELFVIGQF